MLRWSYLHRCRFRKSTLRFDRHGTFGHVPEFIKGGEHSLLQRRHGGLICVSNLATTYIWNTVYPVSSAYSTSVCKEVENIFSTLSFAALVNVQKERFPWFRTRVDRAVKSLAERQYSASAISSFHSHFTRGNALRFSFSDFSYGHYLALDVSWRYWQWTIFAHWHAAFTCGVCYLRDRKTHCITFGGRSLWWADTSSRQVVWFTKRWFGSVGIERSFVLDVA